MARREEPSPVNIGKHLRGIDFPATREELIEYAEENDADEEIIEALQDLDDREYENMADVLDQFGKAA